LFTKAKKWKSYGILTCKYPKFYKILYGIGRSIWINQVNVGIGLKNYFRLSSRGKLHYYSYMEWFFYQSSNNESWRVCNEPSLHKIWCFLRFFWYFYRIYNRWVGTWHNLKQMGLINFFVIGKVTLTKIEIDTLSFNWHLELLNLNFFKTFNWIKLWKSEIRIKIEKVTFSSSGSILNWCCLWLIYNWLLLVLISDAWPFGW